MDTVDKGKGLVELVWCDHTPCVPTRLFGRPETINALIGGRGPVHLIVEEHKIKLLCKDCYLKALQVPMFRGS